MLPATNQRKLFTQLNNLFRQILLIAVNIAHSQHYRINNRVIPDTNDIRFPNALFCELLKLYRAVGTYYVA